MPQIMVNSKDGQGHKGKYLDTSRKICSQEMLMCNMKALIFIIKKLWPMSCQNEVGGHEIYNLLSTDATYQIWLRLSQ